MPGRTTVTNPTRHSPWWFAAAAAGSLLVVVAVLGFGPFFHDGLARLAGAVFETVRDEFPAVVTISLTAVLVAWLAIAGCCWWETRRD